MNNIDKILDMLNWNNDIKVQKERLRLANNIECINCFFRPIGKKVGKDQWENCAKVIAGKEDIEIENYLVQIICG